MEKEKVLQLIDKRIQELKEGKEKVICKTTRNKYNYVITELKNLFNEVEKL